MVEQKDFYLPTTTPSYGLEHRAYIASLIRKNVFEIDDKIDLITKAMYRTNVQI